MDEYLSEKEQIERIRHWWSDYGWYLIGGVAIGLAVLFGYGRWQDGIAARAENASALYSELAAAVEDDDLAEVERTLGVLRSDYADSPYADNGSLLLARMVLVSDPERAIEALRSVMDNSSDAELAMIARLRLARVLAWQEQYDAALALLDIEDAGAFAARASDIRGDILLASGDTEGALAAFTTAMILPGSDALDRNYLQMKASGLLESGSPALLPAGAAPLQEVDLGALAEEFDAQRNAAGDAAAESAVEDSGAAQGSADAAESAEAAEDGQAEEAGAP